VGQAGDEPRLHGIDTEEHDDGDGGGRLLDRQRLLIQDGDNHIDLEPDELSGQGGKTIGLARGISSLEEDVLACDPAEILQGRDERKPGNFFIGRHGFDAENPHARDPAGWLSPGGERRGEEAASDNLEECSSVHPGTVPRDR
jgi:hypothetical protein